MPNEGVQVFFFFSYISCQIEVSFLIYPGVKRALPVTSNFH